MLPKLIAIVGPTATGKSDLAVAIAREVGGEIISADSRQVYRGLTIGTGKITKKEMRGVPHHLLDVADPKRQFSVAQYKKKAQKAIADILKRGNVPILVGGTGFYIDAVLYDTSLPEVKPDKALRKRLAKLSTEKLFTMLTKLDSTRAKNIDRHNPRRLMRAIEIAQTLGKVPKPKRTPQYDTLIIGLDMPDDVLKMRIHDRLIKRTKKGMVAEVKRLRTEGMSWKRMEELGLEYRFLARLLQKKITKEECIAQLETAIWHYAKRQRTWFRRNKEIHWLESTAKIPAKRLAKDFCRGDRNFTARFATL